MTIAEPTHSIESFHWTPQPQAQALVRALFERVLSHSIFARRLKRDLYARAAVRLEDLVDSIHVGAPELDEELIAAGFVRRPIAGAQARYVQEQGIFPAVVLKASGPIEMYLKVESAADFVAAAQSPAAIEGAPLARVRRARMAHSKAAEVWAIERHGWRGFDVAPIASRDVAAVLAHAEAMERRRRNSLDDRQGFAAAQKVIDGAIADLGKDRACDLFFAAERAYWQRRNHAAQAQKARQDSLGVGWANHDHHTYRSSREHFARLIAVLETMGFVCRERFYAGAQSGWGAQVLEQSEAGIVIFADVDLSPDELFDDFAHQGLAPREKLGTVGLWCALHGEALLQAGMHHLECQFDFEALERQLEGGGSAKLMKPFTDFPYLRQAFTEGETWPVDPERIERLLSAGRITKDQAQRFSREGAIGSHLENLERNDGFKGFNQTGVSEIIARTDPRMQRDQH